MLFTIFILYAFVLIYYYIGSQLSPNVLIGALKIGLLFYFPLLFIIISLIGKFGLFPASFGIMGLVDGISLFSIIVLLVLNKYI